MRQEIRLAGFGGQGIILAGFVLGRAAAIYGGREAVFTQSYGPEARGGACAAEIVISDEAIDYPLVTRPDYVVCMSQEALSKYGAGIADGAQLIIDRDLVQANESDGYLRGLPATRIAMDLGNRMAANIVMLGFFVAATGIVSREALEESVRATVRPRHLELNVRALDAGFQQGLAVPSDGLQGAMR
jgi:2-oxoglutarate ferredoxin oxidoreductase subunit gamma